MSFSLLPLTTGFGEAAVDAAISVLFRPQRRIGFLVPNVTLSERHTDELVVTRHPVQQGANISDHAYKEPAQVAINCAWSSSSYSAFLNTLVAGDIAGALTDGLLGESYPQQIYNELLQLQQDREPFDIVTGKRQYSNMLLVGLQVYTDKSSEYALMAQVTCQQVLIVSTSSARLPPRAAQSQPQSTASPTTTGSSQPQPVDSRSSLRILGGLGGLFR